MISGFGTLLAFLLIGELVSRGLHLVVPGTIIGLIGLFLMLQWRIWFRGISVAAVEESDVGRVANALLSNLSIMFVPAGVGIVSLFDDLTVVGTRVVVIIVLSTLLTMVVTALMFAVVSRALQRSTARQDSE